MTKSLTVVQGQKRTVEWAKTRNGKVPARDFFEGLDDPEQAQMLTLFRRLAVRGYISNKEQFKKVVDGLWEFKKYQIRILGDHRPGGRFILALGLKKKDDRHKNKDLQKALDILADHDLREEKS